MGTLVFKPEQIYHRIKNVAPDLIVHFGGLYWRSIGGVGYPTIHVLENDTGPDDCNHAQFGAFVLAASNNPLQGEVTGARLLDVAPTLMDLAGYEVAEAMQGRSLVAGLAGPTDGGYAPDDEAIVRDRLSGLGYIG
jgi:predicted AlkP superfamily phosphohydrolase/phosphomutase